jgi:hypothetical protein
MSDKSIDRRLGMLLDVCDKDAQAGARGPAATPDQLAALERHWGRRLPPLYRRVLAMHNGVPRLWFDAALLSIETIIEGGREMREFEAAAPDHWRWIFARGTESRDALAFDPFHASSDGELPVVHLGESGVVARLPSLGSVLQDLFTRLLTGIRGGGTNTWYLWTGLWTYWSGDRHSRAFAARSNTVEYAGRDSLFARPCDIDTERLLPEHALLEADRRFAHGVHQLGNRDPRFAVILTEKPAEPSATQGYVYYEPCADLVVTLSTVERKASICATNSLWEPWGPSFHSLIASATELLEQHRVADALLHGIDETCELFQRMTSGAQRS